MPARKSAAPTAQEWEAHKSTLQQLYVKDKKTAVEVREHMVLYHGFPAETKTSVYETYFSKWAWRKNISKSTWKAIGARIRAFEQAGQEIEVLVGGEELSLSTVNKRIKRHASWRDLHVNSGSLPPLPPNVIVRPIRSACSSRLPFLTIDLPFQRFEKHLQTSFKSTFRQGSDSSRTYTEPSGDLSTIISEKEADQVLQTEVPCSKADSTAPNRIFTSALHRSIVCSIANNFAGLETMPKRFIFEYLRRQTDNETLRLILSTGSLYTARAISLNLFKGAIEANEDKVLDLLLSMPKLGIQVNKKINVKGRETVPLLWAAELVRTAAMKVLLRHGADATLSVAKPSSESVNQGVVDVYCGGRFERDWDETVFQQLLDAGARPNASTLKSLVGHYRLRHTLGQIVEKYDSPSWEAINENGALLEMFSQWDQVALWRILDLLIQNMVDINHCVKSRDRSWRPAVILDAVALHGYFPLMRRLCEAGATFTAETLSFAVSSGKQDLVIYVLDHLPWDNGFCRRKLTALGAALEQQNEKIIDLVAFSSAVMAAEELLGFDSPLKAAAESGNMVWVERLLQLSGSFDSRRLGLNLRHAVAYRHREVAFLLLAAGADVNILDEQGLPPIYHALRWGDYAMIRALLDEDADPNYHEFEDDDEFTKPAIVLAAESKDTLLVGMLVRAGVDLHSGLKDCSGPLATAAMNNDKTMFKCLIEVGCDINKNPRVKPEQDVLCRAIDTRDVSMLQFVLDHGADPHDSVALYHALWGGWRPRADREMADLLLTRHRRRYGNQIPWASQVLRETIHKDDYELFHKVLQYGGDPGRAPKGYWLCEDWNDDDYDDDDEGEDDPRFKFNYMTPFGCSIAWSQDRKTGLKYAEYLIRNGHRHFGNCRPESIVEDSTRGGRENPVSRSTAFLVAIETGYLPVIKLLLDEGGADVNYPAELGIKRTPLQKAAERGKLEIIQLLLDRGADVNAPAAKRGGGTALQLAALKGNYKAVCLLLEKGADVNAAASHVNGRTALEAAAEHLRLDILELLLRAIASTGQNSTEQVASAIKLAEQHGRHPVVEILHAFSRNGLGDLRDPDPAMSGSDTHMDVSSPDFDALFDFNGYGP